MTKNRIKPLALTFAALLGVGVLAALAQTGGVPHDDTSGRQTFVSVSPEDWTWNKEDRRNVIRVGPEGGSVTLHSLTIHEDRLSIFNARGDLLGIAIASPYVRSERMSADFEGSVQLDFDVTVETPITITLYGVPDFHMVYTP